MSAEDVVIRLPVLVLVGDLIEKDVRSLVVRTQARRLAEAAEKLVYAVMRGLVRDGFPPSRLGTSEGKPPGVTFVVRHGGGEPVLSIFAVALEGEIGAEPVSIRGKWLVDRETLVKGSLA